MDREVFYSLYDQNFKEQGRKRVNIPYYDNLGCSKPKEEQRNRSNHLYKQAEAISNEYYEDNLTYLDLGTLRSENFS